MGRKEDYREAMEASYDVIKDANPEAVSQWDSFDDFFASDQGKEALKDPIGDPNSTEYSDLTGKELSDALIKKSQENMMTAIVESDPEFIEAKEEYEAAAGNMQTAIAYQSHASGSTGSDFDRAALGITNEKAERLLALRRGEFQLARNKKRAIATGLRKKLEASLAAVTIVNFSEQCFLMANIFEFVNWKESNDMSFGKTMPDTDGTNNASLLVTGSPYNFMNKLTQNANYKAFFNMSVAAISSLQPMIRLYKIIQDKNGKEIEHEIKFDSHYTTSESPGSSAIPQTVKFQHSAEAETTIFGGSDLDDFMNNKNARGHGVGIKEFSFSYEGQDFFALKKSIKAKLVIMANDFSELLRERTTGGPETYKYIDLALKTSNTPTAEFKDKLNVKSEAVFNNMARLNFRLKAVVGWARPQANEDIISTELRDAIYDSYITLQLSPMVHAFDFDDLGRVTFTLEYLAYVEDVFDGGSFNIFTEEKSVQNITRRNLEASAFNKYCNKESNAALKENATEEITQDKKRLYSDLETKAIKEKIIYVAPLNYDDIAVFNDRGAYYDYKYSAQIQTAKTADMASEIVDDAPPRTVAEAKANYTARTAAVNTDAAALKKMELDDPDRAAAAEKVETSVEAWRESNRQLREQAYLARLRKAGHIK